MRRRQFLRILAVTGCAAVAGCAAGDNSLALVRRSGRLRVGLDASFPPFEAVAPEGNIVGLDADLASYVASALDVQPEWHNIAYDGLYDALAARQVDMLASALPSDPLRTRDVSYSQPYFYDGVVLIGEPGAPLAAKLADVTGRLAVEMGSESAALARRLVRRAEVIEMMSEADVMAAVAGAKADWGLVGLVSACAHAETSGSFVIGVQLTQVPYCLVTRAQDKALSQAVSAALESILASAAWQACRRKWLGAKC